MKKLVFVLAILFTVGITYAGNVNDNTEKAATEQVNSQVKDDKEKKAGCCEKKSAEEKKSCCSEKKSKETKKECCSEKKSCGDKK